MDTFRIGARSYKPGHAPGGCLFNVCERRSSKQASRLDPVHTSKASNWERGSPVNGGFVRLPTSLGNVV